ncbi:MAG: penicillin acylase family protein [Bacteroidales bacterium]|nr:penicillin acylase family protein [Bacteroidales bacterium]
MKKILVILFVSLIIIVIGLVVFLKKFNTTPLPDYNQNITLLNLNSEVEVYRDENGIPHIIAQNEEDLYRAAGYILASDRLWQMDLIRRATQGTLSEIFGADFFKTDLMLRSLKIEQKSEEIYQNLPNDQKLVLDAYADGVNQYIQQNSKKLPIEFKILGYKPAQWQPQNSLNIIGYIAWDLVTAWSNEIALYKIQQRVDSAIFADFVPNFSDNMQIYDITLSDTSELSSPISTMGQNILDLGIVPFMASNNWAVSGQKTNTGAPILCNDMHLGFGIPGIWYQMHLSVEGKVDVAGLTIPGAPGIVAGHNQNIAWGLTNVMLDGTDFYIETLNDDSTQYFFDGQWVNLKIDTEKIVTKEGDTLIGKIKYTHRGPIISEFKKLNQAISMHWIGYDYSNEFGGIYKLNRASNWDEFREGCKDFGAVSQNIVYADNQGNIGIQLVGSVPKRIVPGFMLFPGDTSKYDWDSFIAFDSLPFEYNPTCGFVASANNKSSNDVNYYISQYYYQDFRYKRIVEMLSANDSISVDYMKLVQNDQNSAFAKSILPDMIFQIASLNFDDPKYQRALEFLSAWDGNMTPDGVAPLIFEQFNLMFLNEVAADELGSAFDDFYKSKILVYNIILNLYQNKSSVLFDNINTADVTENITDIFRIAYTKTIDTLSAQLGNDVALWEYQKIHTITFEHPLSKVKILDLLFKFNRGPYGVGGSNHTVSPYSYPLNSNYKVTTGASHRHIFTVNNWETSQTIIPTGQSGIPSSKFYCDQTERYLSGQYHDDYFSLQRVKDNAKFKMIFKPE